MKQENKAFDIYLESVRLQIEHQKELDKALFRVNIAGMFCVLSILLGVAVLVFLTVK